MPWLGAVAAVLIGLAAIVGVTAGLRLPGGGPYWFTRRPLADAGVFALAGAAVAIHTPLVLGGLALAAVAGALLDRLAAALGFDARRPGDPAPRTTPPGKFMVLYDGQCVFCRRQMERLVRVARPGAIEAVDFQAPGALDAFPGVTWDACMAAMQLVTPEGRVYSGFEAAVHTVATRPVGKLGYVYYLPGLRFVLDAVYAVIAAYRYRIAGRMVAAGACDDGACAVHFAPRPR